MFDSLVAGTSLQESLLEQLRESGLPQADGHAHLAGRRAGQEVAERQQVGEGLVVLDRVLGRVATADVINPDTQDDCMIVRLFVSRSGWLMAPGTIMRMNCFNRDGKLARATAARQAARLNRGGSV